MRALYLVPLLAGLALVFYPLLVYLGLGYWGVKPLALLLMVLACLRLAVSRWLGIPSGNAVLVMIVIALVAGITLATGSVAGLKVYPVVMNALMLGVFAFSLWQPPSMIERFARLREPDLPLQAIPYTRKVTIVWCVFFTVNGAIAAATLFASDQVWAIYNGFVAYVLMGLLFAGEYLVRQRIRQ